MIGEKKKEKERKRIWAREERESKKMGEWKTNDREIERKREERKKEKEKKEKVEREIKRMEER